MGLFLNSEEKNERSDAKTPFWQVDNQIAEFAEMHFFTTKQACSLTGESYKRNSRRIFRGRKRKRRRLHVRGRLEGINGRPEDVIGRRRMKPGTEYHEVCLTDIVLSIPEGKFERSYSLERQADMIMHLVRKFFIEFDTGEESKSQIQGKWKQHYLDCTDLLLVVADDEKRIERLKSWSELVSDIAWFTTLKETIANGVDSEWTNIGGFRITLRQMAGSKPDKPGG